MSDTSNVELSIDTHIMYRVFMDKVSECDIGVNTMIEMRKMQVIK